MFIVVSESDASSGGERHQGSKSDAAPLELITLSIRFYKHWAPPEPRNDQPPGFKLKLEL